MLHDGDCSSNHDNDFSHLDPDETFDDTTNGSACDDLPTTCVPTGNNNACNSEE